MNAKCPKGHRPFKGECRRCAHARQTGAGLLAADIEFHFRYPNHPFPFMGGYFNCICSCERCGPVSPSYLDKSIWSEAGLDRKIADYLASGRTTGWYEEYRASRRKAVAA
jgi:hypothetical protein